ncbi:hypothetical protein [Wenling hepe-like virus 2]|uniref:hypothetical protein n=1 Tax=Wenling hepe-like virus 2 TaxID=1923494 RepID=UPI00090C0CDA|nr:hypothetical protein [Wenling hepe-like virus 2]APG77830.1 hypothetical protein [Wenling hepe-like virus 2]
MSLTENNSMLNCVAPTAPALESDQYTSANTPNIIVDDGNEGTVKTIRITETIGIASQEEGYIVFRKDFNRAALSALDDTFAANFRNHELWRMTRGHVTLSNAEKFSTASSVLKYGQVRDAQNNPPTDVKKLKAFISSNPLAGNINGRCDGSRVGFDLTPKTQMWPMKYTTNANRDPNSMMYPPFLMILCTKGSTPIVNLQADISITLEFFAPLKKDETTTTDNKRTNLNVNAVTITLGRTIEDCSADFTFTADPVVSAIGAFTPDRIPTWELDFPYGDEEFQRTRVTLGHGVYDFANKRVRCAFTDMDFALPDGTNSVSHNLTPTDVSGTVTFVTQVQNGVILQHSMNLQQDYDSAIHALEAGFKDLKPLEKVATIRLLKQSMLSKGRLTFNQ